MKIAICSTDGVNVNEHFGRAERFLVYEMIDGKPALIDERPTIPLSVGDPDHPFDPDRFGKVADVIEDCGKVYLAKIGDVPAEKLKERGIEPVTYRGLIKDVAP